MEQKNILESIADYRKVAPDIKIVEGVPDLSKLSHTTSIQEEHKIISKSLYILRMPKNFVNIHPNFDYSAGHKFIYIFLWNLTQQCTAQCSQKLMNILQNFVVILRIYDL